MPVTERVDAHQRLHHRNTDGQIGAPTVIARAAAVGSPLQCAWNSRSSATRASMIQSPVASAMTEAAARSTVVRFARGDQMSKASGWPHRPDVSISATGGPDGISCSSASPPVAAVGRLAISDVTEPQRGSRRHCQRGAGINRPRPARSALLALRDRACRSGFHRW
jgi:hypothetical protein